MRYSVVIFPEPEAGGYSVSVPAIPGCVTQGETMEEALAMAAEAAALLLEVMVEDGEELPTEAPGVVFTSVDVAVPDLASVGREVASVASAD